MNQNEIDVLCVKYLNKKISDADKDKLIDYLIKFRNKILKLVWGNEK